MREYTPKNLWRVRVNGHDEIWKSDFETLNEMWEKDEITEFTTLRIKVVKKGE